MQTTEITFFTHPSVWQGRFEPHNEPYERIAGLHVAGQYLWQMPDQLPGENGYNKNDTTPITMELSTHFANRVAGYFYDHYARPAMKFSPTVDRSLTDIASNCHKFGTEMLAGKPQDYVNSYGIACEIMSRQQPVSVPQRLGELAIIGGHEDVDHTKQPIEVAEHTLVALGEEGEHRYLEVNCFNGNLSITTLASSIKHYRSLLSNDVMAYGSRAPQRNDIQPYVEHLQKRIRRRK